LKAQAKRLFDGRFDANPYGRGTKREAVADTAAARRVVIENAWDISIQ
jgi:hypothetical protein